MTRRRSGGSSSRDTRMICARTTGTGVVSAEFSGVDHGAGYGHDQTANDGSGRRTATRGDDCASSFAVSDTFHDVLMHAPWHRAMSSCMIVTTGDALCDVAAKGGSNHVGFERGGAAKLGERLTPRPVSGFVGMRLLHRNRRTFDGGQSQRRVTRGAADITRPRNHGRRAANGRSGDDCAILSPFRDPAS